jgi:WD40 repeat protein/transcriptional regulator with XRE-family HTH domain
MIWLRTPFSLSRKLFSRKTFIGFVCFVLFVFSQNQSYHKHTLSCKPSFLQICYFVLFCGKLFCFAQFWYILVWEVIIMGRKEKSVSQENTIGARMRIARIRKGITLSELAKTIGYTKGRLSTVENSFGRPSRELVQAYEQALEMEPGSLLAEQDDGISLGRRYSTLSDDEFGSVQVKEAPVSAKATLIASNLVAPSPHDALVPTHKVQEYISEAPRIGSFYGRTRELEQLQTWIAQDACRIVTILGIGGVGKTMLASVLKEQLRDSFDYIYWRTLLNAPPLAELLTDCLHFLSGQEQVTLPEERDEQITMLGDYLRQQRCLLIFDNVETILSTQQSAGSYRSGYEDYSRLFSYIGEGNHQSCLLLTSRELPQDVEALVGQGAHTLPLSGVGLDEGRMILQEKGLSGTEQEFVKLISIYAGNPLALMLVVSPIRDIFGGEIGEFLAERGAVIDDIYELIDSQFHRLSAEEQEIIYWLALACEPISLNELLKEKIVRPVPKRILLNALNSLRRRSMIENSSGSLFSLQPVIMEYVTDEFVAHICREIEAAQFSLLASHALIRAEAKDHIRNNQIRLFLEPVARLLLTQLGMVECEAKLKQLLTTLRVTRPLTPEYAAGNLLNLLVQLKIDIRGYDFSNLVVWNAYLQGVSLPDVKFAGAHLENCVFTETFGSILSVSLRARDDLLAAATANGEVRLWNARSGAPLGICQGHTDWVRSVSISPDGRTVLSGSDDQLIRLWDVKTTQCLKTFYGHTNRVRSVVFSPDGRLAASGSDDFTVRLWNMDSEDCINTFHGHSSRVWSVAFRPDGKLLVSGGSDYTVKIWDITTGECLRTLKGHTARICSVTCSSDGRLVASGSDDQTVRVWDIESGECIRILRGHTERVWSVTFSPVGSLLASGSDDRAVRLWDIESGECLGVMRGHTNRVWAVAFSADGNAIVSGGDDQTIRMWNTDDGLCFKMLQGHSSRVRSVAFSPDGAMLISGSDDRTVRLWQVENGHCLKILQGHSTWIYAVAFSPTGSLLASGSDDQTIRLWDVASGYSVRTLGGHTNWVRSLGFSPDGTRLVSGGDDQTVRIWQVSTGLCLATFKLENNRIWSVAFNPAGKHVASGGEDQIVRIWSVDNGQLLQTLKGHEKRVRGVSFSPDGTKIASCSDDGTIRLWEISSGQCLRILRGHPNWVWSVVFSPDGQLLASGGDDQGVHLWRWSDEQHLWAGYEHSKRIYSVAFSPASSLIASGSYDGTIKFWDAATGRCVNTLQRERPYENMDITSVGGLSSAQRAMLRTLGAIER